MKIAFIGAGRMAEALISRLPKNFQVIAADVDQKRLSTLVRKYGLRAVAGNQAAFSAGDVVILAVKPQQMAAVAAELKTADFRRRPKIIVSIAAGVPLRWLGKQLPGQLIVRAMPNNPCLVGAGITALAKGKRVAPGQLNVVNKIFKAVGEVVELPEKMLDAVTGLSGSGPAYVYWMIEGLVAGGVAAGLPQQLAKKLAVETVIGAAVTAKQTAHSLTDLRMMVASPGGTTVEG